MIRVVHAALLERVRPSVPELVRVDPGNAGKFAAALDDLVEAGRLDRAPFADPEKWRRRLGVLRPGEQVEVEGFASGGSARDAPLALALADDPESAIVDVDERIQAMVGLEFYACHLRDAQAGVEKSEDQGLVAPLAEAPAAAALQEGLRWSELTTGISISSG